MVRRVLLAWLAVVFLLSACGENSQIDYSGPVAGWPDVTGSKGGGQFSPLTQIDKDNVTRLEVAWTYSSDDFKGPGGYDETGKTPEGDGVHSSVSVSVTPIIAGDTMLLCTPLHRVVALDPETGRELWSYDPQMDRAMQSHVCRGVARWNASDSLAGRPCQQRVLFMSGDGRLIALDVGTGLPCVDFGEGGTVDLTHGLGPVKRGEYYQTSPPLVFGDLVIAGSAVRDSFRTETAGGVIRAFDVRSGRLVWAWDPVPPGMPAVTAEDIAKGGTFTRGTPNSWALLSADVDNNLLFVPTGNPGVDYYRGKSRDRFNYYGSSVVALNALTGAVVWHFQTVHHDIWDYDIGTQPVLYQHRGNIPAVAVATKQGHLFLLNRLNGEPLFPVEERPVPGSDVPTEWTSPTQPFPTLPEPIAGSALTDRDLMNYPFVSKGCQERFARLRSGPLFTPPSLQGTLIYPGIGGGFNWGGMAVNPATGTMVTTYLRMPFSVQLLPRQNELSAEQDNEPVNFNWMRAPQYGTPYRLSTDAFLSDRGIPCIKPPWGMIMAIDLASGNTIWKKPIGSLNGYIPLIGRWIDIGTPVSGGPLQTASGLVFVAATTDEYFRALDAQTGEVLWAKQLPFSAHAIPMTYRLSPQSRQFLVIASGGSIGMDKRTGNTLVAFALPK